jgi:hypothetical protein
VICVGIIHTEYSHKTRLSAPRMAFWDDDTRNRVLKPEYKVLVPTLPVVPGIGIHKLWVTRTPVELMQAATTEHENHLADTVPASVACETAQMRPTRTQPTRTQPSRTRPARACAQLARTEPIRFRALPKRTKARRRKPTARRDNTTPNDDLEYSEHDKLIGPPIRTTQSDPTKDLILATREGSKVHILETTVRTGTRARGTLQSTHRTTQPATPPTACNSLAANWTECCHEKHEHHKQCTHPQRGEQPG